MIVGSVGSGKSTVAMAALGEVYQVGGERSLIGSVAYVPQEVLENSLKTHRKQAWIMNATLKENILFGEIFDADKYDRVLEAAALK